MRGNTSLCGTKLAASRSKAICRLHLGGPMLRKAAFLFFLIVFASGAFAETLETLSLSKKFAKTPGTPRVIRNGSEHEWLVAWRQEGGSGKIVGRRVASDGTLQKRKTLAKGVSENSQNLDIFYDSVAYTYLLVWEGKEGLKSQVFTGDLSKQGSSNVVVAGISNAFPRLAYNATQKQFLLFWLDAANGAPHTVLKSILLDQSGAPAGAVEILAQSGSGKSFESLSVSTNQKKGNLVVIVLEQSAGGSGLIGFLVKPDGTLLKSKPVTFEPNQAGLFTVGDASFADNGKGFGFWSAQTLIKYRTLNSKGKVGSEKSIPDTADASSLQTSMLFDQRNNQFIGCWGQGNKISAVVLNGKGAIQDGPFVVSSNDGAAASINVATSYDAQLGNAIVVWDDQIGSGSGAKYQTRAALFVVESAATLQGITIGDTFFTSSNGTGNISITAGDTVTWTNQGALLHTATSGSESSSPGALFDSGNLSPGQAFSFRFLDAGVFPYFCLVHGSSLMKGTITVADDYEDPPDY